MAVQRFLGAGWASVHGPVDERKLAIWALESGFAGLLAGPGPRPIDWVGLRSQIADLPFELAGLWLQGPNAGLGSAQEGDRRSALAAIQSAVELALRLGVKLVVLEPGAIPVSGEVPAEDLTDRSAGWTTDSAGALAARCGPGRDGALDRVCRALYALTRATPELTFALRPSAAVTGLGRPDELAAIFEDLPDRGLAYWHMPAITVCRKYWLGEDPGVWLEQFGDRMVGSHLGDGSNSAIDLPPGAGLVDYGLLASYIPRSAPLPGVLELDPGIDPGEIAGARAFLSKFGL